MSDWNKVVIIPGFMLLERKCLCKYPALYSNVVKLCKVPILVMFIFFQNQLQQRVTKPENKTKRN